MLCFKGEPHCYSCFLSTDFRITIIQFSIKYFVFNCFWQYRQATIFHIFLGKRWKGENMVKRIGLRLVIWKRIGYQSCIGQSGTIILLLSFPKKLWIKLPYEAERRKHVKVTLELNKWEGLNCRSLCFWDPRYIFLRLSANLWNKEIYISQILP